MLATKPGQASPQAAPFWPFAQPPQSLMLPVMVTVAGTATEDHSGGHWVQVPALPQ